MISEDKTVCLIVSNDEKENDVHVYLGKMQKDSRGYCFVNEEKGWRVSLDDDQLNKLQPVPKDLKKMLLLADYFLSMNIGDLPESKSENYRSTGMKWHD